MIKRNSAAIYLLLVLCVLFSGCANTGRNTKTEKEYVSESKSENTEQIRKQELTLSKPKRMSMNDEKKMIKETESLPNKVKIEVEGLGTMEAELYPETAPITAANFKKLVSEGFYDGLTFHRSVPGFVIQGGDPDGTGMGGPDYTITGEFELNGFKNELKHETGVLSMARSEDYNSAGSQFFIMLGSAPHLDGGYAAFGKLTKGQDIAEKVAAKPTSGQTLTPGVVISKISFIED